MEKSVLNLYLKKLASGDQSYAERVCSRLSNRLIFVPAQLVQQGRHVRYSAVTITFQDRLAVPLFTTEKLFRSWIANSDVALEPLRILGADLCTALDVTMPAVVDPGSDHQVLLEPELIDFIAVAPIDEEGFSEGAVTKSLSINQIVGNGGGQADQSFDSSLDQMEKKKSFLNFLKAAKA